MSMLYKWIHPPILVSRDSREQGSFEPRPNKLQSWYKLVEALVTLLSTDPLKFLSNMSPFKSYLEASTT